MGPVRGGGGGLLGRTAYEIRQRRRSLVRESCSYIDRDFPLNISS